MTVYDFGTWKLEMDGAQAVGLSSLVYGPVDNEAPEVVWAAMVDLLNKDLKACIDRPHASQWAEEVTDAKLDGTGPRISYLSLVWEAVTKGLTKEQHYAGVKHWLRLRRYRNLTWNDFRRMNLPAALVAAKHSSAPSNVQEPLLRYIETIDKWILKGVGFIFDGKSRSGKSGCAAILAKAAVSRGRSAFFTRVSELRDAIKYDTPFSDDTSVWNRCRNVDFLVLDNLLPEDATLPYLNASALTDLVTFRGERQRATVLTTQLKPDDLKSPSFGSFIASTSCYLVPLTVAGNFNDPEALRRELLGANKRG